MQPAHHGMVSGEPARQRHRQVRRLPGGPRPALRQVRQHRAAPRRSPSISASTIAMAETPVTSDTTDDSLIPAVSSAFCSRWISEARAWTVHPVPGQVPHFPQVRRRDVRARQQPALVQVRQPDRVPRVGLVTLQGLGVRRVDHHHLLEVQLGQGVVHRVGVQPRGFHHHVGDAAAPQFAAHLLQHPIKRAELQHVGLALAPSVTRDPDRDLDHVLVHIDRGHPVMNHPHAPPPEAASHTEPGTQGAPPDGTPHINQETDTRARSSSGHDPQRGPQHQT